MAPGGVICNKFLCGSRIVRNIQKLRNYNRLGAGKTPQLYITMQKHAKELFWNCTTCLTVADEVGLKNSNIRTNEGTNLHKLTIFWEAAK